MGTLTVEQCAELAGIGVSTWRAYVARGQAPAALDGYDPATGKRRWDETAVRAWVDNRAGQGARTDLVSAWLKAFVEQFLGILRQRGMDASVDEVEAWYRTGMPAAVAAQWRWLGFSPDEAAQKKADGISPFKISADLGKDLGNS